MLCRHPLGARISGNLSRSLTHRGSAQLEACWMNPFARRRVMSLIAGWAVALSVLLTLGAPTALGALTARTWHATIGGAVSGASAVLVINLDRSGSVGLSTHGLAPTTRYSVMLYTGTCARPHAIVRLPALLTDQGGSGSSTVPLTRGQGGAVWAVASGASIAVRIATGSDARCATLTYPVATRVALAALRIDLPVIVQPGHAFPYCNVALYLSSFSQPGERGPTFIYAHARTGMFLALLQASMVHNGAAMIGMIITVWTSDGLRRSYRVTHVLRHQYVIPAYNPDVSQLWLQTSEGPYGTYNKLFIEATPIAVAIASDEAAHPTPHPLVCSLY
jgi:hypothetical protein